MSTLCEGKMALLAAKLESRRQITAAGCWEWTGARHPLGYGIVWFDRALHRANRAAWLAYRGPIPDGLIVLHSCDNPPCFNPDHLRIGSKRENTADMRAKGRIATGARHGAGKMSNEKANELRSLWLSGSFTQSDLAERFDIHLTSVSRIVRGVRRRGAA